MPVLPVPAPAAGLRDLDELARELTGRGWAVRFESSSFAAEAPGGHLVLTRRITGAAEYVVALPRRHEVHVWVRSGGATWPLGTVVDAVDVHDLLRREAGAAGFPRRPRTAQ